MLYTYNDLKMHCANRVDIFRAQYVNFFEILEDLYNSEEIKKVYIKNLFNSNDVQTFFFFEGKIVKMTISDLLFNIEEIKYGIVKKQLSTSRKFERDVQLKLTFDDSSEIIFNNCKDSNPDFQWDYGQDIKELYKFL
ncbi:hypothetical protein [Lysinibacillus capsici]|uniref:hypothetical protein n=1 Tax=Lysinibacillus capsici TaxID=2115968 RepID=UPI003D058C7C